ncbi:MAG: Dinitrogenase iron-molybdenum cofactor [Peptococcaceae bacterium]|nr:Dinitrogenase iron-molybdenum cofactor [Peptococcaceae bacterium]
MKLAVSCMGNSLSDALDERFGRASNFIIFDLANQSYQCLDNVQVLNAEQGAGIQAAQNLVNAGADIVITGHVGPKAFRTLKEAGVDIYFARGITVQEAIEAFKQGKLEKAESNNVEGHWI